MSYDLEVLVTGRKKLKPLVIDNIRIEINPQGGGRHRYHETFPYMAEVRGTWCSLFDTNLENRCLSAFYIAKISENISEIPNPFWEDDYEKFILNIRPEYQQSFQNTLVHLQTFSPIKRIMFLPRLQGIENNCVCGVISLNKFFELLESNKILFNIVYIIQN